MRTITTVVAVALAVTSWNCGGSTSRFRGAYAQPLSVTGATVTFITRQDGKDEDSAIAVQLLDDNARLAAEGTIVDVDFDDNTVSRPLTLSLMRSMSESALDNMRVRLRLTPDGRDTWTFEMRLAVRMSNGDERHYFWSGLRLDEGSPERMLSLASGRMP